MAAKKFYFWVYDKQVIFDSTQKFLNRLLFTKQRKNSDIYVRHYFNFSAFPFFFNLSYHFLKEKFIQWRWEKCQISYYNHSKIDEIYEKNHTILSTLIIFIFFQDIHSIYNTKVYALHFIHDSTEKNICNFPPTHQIPFPPKYCHFPLGFVDYFFSILATSP